MQPEDVLTEKFSNLHSIGSRMSRNEMSHLGEVANNDKDGITSLALGEVGNEIQRDHFPWSLRDRHELERCGSWFAIRFVDLAAIASLHILDNVSFHLRPKEFRSKLGKSAIDARMRSSRCIVHFVKDQSDQMFVSWNAQAAFSVLDVDKQLMHRDQRESI